MPKTNTSLFLGHIGSDATIYTHNFMLKERHRELT